jgi:hypothetical protein
MPASEAVKRAVAAYQRRNPDKMRLKSKAYREANPDYSTNHYYAHLDIMRERNRICQDRRYRFKQEFRRLANICIT